MKHFLADKSACFMVLTMRNNALMFYRHGYNIMDDSSGIFYF